MDELGAERGPIVMGDVAATSGRPLMPLDLSHVVRAERRIRGAVVSTPQDVSWVLSEHLGVSTVVKAEYLQRGGSFKVRGAFNAVAAAVERERPAGVVAGSSGNFGYAVALAARANGMGAAIILAQDTPAFKRRMIEACGASVVEYNRYTEDRVDVVRRAAAERGWTVISGNDNPDVVAGQGTVALELLGAMRDLDVLVLPVGSGSLLAGAAVVAGSLWPDGRLVGVEPVAADDAQRSIEAEPALRLDLEHHSTEHGDRGRRNRRADPLGAALRVRAPKDRSRDQRLNGASGAAESVHPSRTRRTSGARAHRW
jgi:threo-3-hydroxy-L-aspartate ammonia-lyase